MTMPTHERWMRRCLDLAEQGRGAVGNGALVGAVLVRDGEVLAEGFHSGYGKPHAERDLLQKFDQINSTKDTLYVNLEPCCHQGKTPPCTDAILAAGIKRVVFGMVDPDPRVAGRGVAALRAGGINVVGPVCASLCERFNRGFASVRRSGRPFITLKQAIAADGSIANEDGSPKRITSDAQNAWSHAWLRARHDAIVVGVGTIATDNPKLNNRSDQVFSYEKKIFIDQKNRTYKKSEQFQPLRIILDPRLRCPLTATVLTDDRPDCTMLVVDALQVPEYHPSLAPLRDRGIEIVRLEAAEGSLLTSALWEALLTLNGGAKGCTSVLVEGGRATWRRVAAAHCVDEYVLLSGS